MYKFTESNLDWDIILEGISEIQLGYFVGKDKEYKQYSNTYFTQQFEYELDKWVDILNKTICLDFEVINILARYLSNQHKINYRKVRGELVKRYYDVLSEYHEYLEYMYRAKDYLEVNTPEEVHDINEAINQILTLDLENKDYHIANYIEDKCIDGDLHTLVNIITINKLKSLQ